MTHDPERWDVSDFSSGESLAVPVRDFFETFAWDGEPLDPDALSASEFLQYLS